MSTEVIAFGDIEGALITYLDEHLDVPVSTTVASERPGEFVRVVRLGGNRRNLVTDNAVVVFECWASTTPAAADLASLTRAHVHALAGQHAGDLWVYAVREIGGPAYSPDPTADVPRYTFSAQISYRGEALA